MTISTLIKKLDDIKSYHGDLELICKSQVCDIFEPISVVEYKEKAMIYMHFIDNTMIFNHNSQTTRMENIEVVEK